MPAIHSTPIQIKAHVLNLIDFQRQSIRKTASIFKIPKSTLHDNLSKYRAEMSFLQAQEGSKQDAIDRAIISISIEGKSSSRDCVNVIETMLGIKISHQHVLNVLNEAGKAASDLNNSINKDPDTKVLQKVLSLGGDEIFQSGVPILAIMDLASSYIQLISPGDRTKESWLNFLKDLKDLGLDPSATTADGGKAFLGAGGIVFPFAQCLLDLFHVLYVLNKAKRSIEGKCYSLLKNYYKNASQSGRDQASQAIDMFDALEGLIEKFRKASYISSESCYVTSSTVEGMIGEIISLLQAFIGLGFVGDRIRKAKSYLKNGTSGIVAYKKMLENAVKKAFSGQWDDMVLTHICPIIEAMDQLQRERENSEKSLILKTKIASMRARFRCYTIADQNEVDAAIQKVAGIMAHAKKSNSLIESANSVIRRFLSTYKKVPKWFCALFTFFWNNRRFTRGKRAKLKPLEILSGQHIEGNWIDKLQEQMRANRNIANSIEV